MGTNGGFSSGDFKLSNSSLRILYSLIKDSLPSLAADGLTQSNPSVVTTASAKSTTLPANVKKGVLAGSVAFTRPDIGANSVGGAAQVGSAYVAKTRPLGLFINDAAGNANENAPAAGAGKCPFLRGGSVGVKVYETAVQTTAGSGVVGTALTYAVGDRLYASVNGLLTNRFQDSYEYQWITTANTGNAADGSGDAAASDCTCMGVVLSPPDATSSEMFCTLSLV